MSEFDDFNLDDELSNLDIDSLGLDNSDDNNSFNNTEGEDNGRFNVVSEDDTKTSVNGSSYNGIHEDYDSSIPVSSNNDLIDTDNSTEEINIEGSNIESDGTIVKSLEGIVSSLQLLTTPQAIRVNESLLSIDSSLLTKEESSLLSYLITSYKDSNVFPSKQLVENKLEVSIPDNTLSYKDILISINSLIKTKYNKSLSRTLMEMSSKVLAGEDIDISLLDKYHSDNNEHIDSTASPQSFLEYYNKKEQLPTGLVTNIKEIDNLIGGIPPSTVTTIGGFVGSFKSTLGLNIAYYNSKKLKYNIVYISLEMSKESVLSNLLCRHSFEPTFSEYPFIPHNSIKKAILTPEQKEYLFNTVMPDYYSTGGKLKILDESDFPTFSFKEIRDQLIKADDEFTKETGYGLDAVVFDHANLFKFNKTKENTGNDTTEGNRYVGFIRALANHFRIDPITKESRKLAMIILAQVSRDGWRRATKNNGKYNLTAFAEINGLERDSSYMFTVYTNESMKLAKEAYIQLLKARDGQTMEEPLSFFVDPEAYVAGEEVEGFSDMISTSDLDSVFDGGLF